MNNYTTSMLYLFQNEISKKNGKNYTQSPVYKLRTDPHISQERRVVSLSDNALRTK